MTTKKSEQTVTLNPEDYSKLRKALFGVHLGNPDCSNCGKKALFVYPKPQEDGVWLRIGDKFSVRLGQAKAQPQLIKKMVKVAKAIK